MHNLLTEPLIRYRQSSEPLYEVSLPEVYAALMAEAVVAFPALRPHQRHAWHSFLVQAGALAMNRAGMNTLPTDADEWRRIIHGLTPTGPTTSRGNSWWMTSPSQPSCSLRRVQRNERRTSRTLSPPPMTWICW